MRMTGWIALGLAGLLGGGSALGQVWAKAKLEQSPRHQEWVTVHHGGRAVKCFVVYPEVSGKAPAVLVIHEIFGLSDWAKDLTDEVAAAGYVAIAPDLLSGVGPDGGGTAKLEPQGRSAVTEAVSELPEEQVTADLDAAADYVKTVPACNGTLYVAGFCWGGGKSFLYATHRHDLKAAFVFYGVTPDEDLLSRITCPVYGFYAGNDARITVTVPDTRKAMAAAGRKYEAVIYPGAGHGFMRAGEDPAANAANRRAHDKAWKRWKELLGGVSVAIGGDGTIYFDGKAASDRELELALAQAHDADPDVAVMIRGDEKSQLKRLEFIFDACRKAGLTKFNLQDSDF